MPTDTTQIETLEAQNSQLKRDLLKTQNEAVNDKEELNFKLKQVEKIKVKTEALTQENQECKQQFERLKIDYEKQQQELKIALENVESLTAENEELRGNLATGKAEPAIDTTQAEAPYLRKISPRMILTYLI